MGARVTAAASAALLIASIGASQAAGTPAITGTDADVWTVASPVPTYDITASPLALTDEITWSLDGGAGGSGASPLTVKLPGIPDGVHTLAATDLDLLSPAAQRTFRLDLTPPKITVNRPASGVQIDLGAQIAADFTCEGAVSCVGTVAAGAAIDTSSAGAKTFSVQATDDVGNESITLVDYVVRAPASSAPAGSSAQPSEPISLVQAPTAGAPTTGPKRQPYRPRTLNAKVLRPAVGLRLPTRTPLLRWPAHPRASLYNVQVFWLRGTMATKVVSVFPRGHNIRIPRGRVAFGKTYIWRVWPYVKGRYTSRPLGLSYFTVRAQPR